MMPVVQRLRMNQNAGYLSMDRRRGDIRSARHALPNQNGAPSNGLVEMLLKAIVAAV